MWCSSCTNVSPQPMMWPGGHQCSQNGWSASLTSTVLKPRAVAVGAEHLQLVQALHVEGERSLRPVDLPLEGVAAAEREPRRLDRADGAVLELDRGLDRVVDLPPGQERLHEPGDGRDLAVQEPREVDHVRAEVAERAGAGLVDVEAPRVERRVVAPVLEVAAAEVPDLAELAGLDHLPRQPNGRHEAVVEPAEVLHARRSDAAPDLVGLVGVAPERLLADHVLARLGRRDRRLRVQRVGAAVVEEPDPVVGDELAPVGGRVLVAVALRRLADRLLVAARDADEPRLERRRPRDVRDLLERVRVRLAHERVAQHADADLSHRRRYYASPFNREGVQVANAVKWGIISTADINRKVIPGAHASPKVELVAVASRDQARADEYAKTWEIERAYGSYDALLADPEIEAVYISLPNTMHCEWSIKALEAGKHVLCEKPLSRHSGRGRGRVRRSRPHRPAAERGVHVPPQPADEAREGARRRGRDRRVAARPLRLQLLALRRGQHPPADGRRGRRVDGRRLLHRQRLAPLRRRARAGTRRGVVRAVRDRLGLRCHAPVPRRRARDLRLRHRDAGARRAGGDRQRRLAVPR